MKTTHYLMPSKRLAIFFTITCLLSTVTSNIGFCEETPTSKSQATGFYQIMVGDFEVTALSDGTNKRSVEQQLQLLNGDQNKIRDLLVRAYPGEQMESGVNAFLINTGAKRVLVDAGNGRMGSSTMGNVINNLRAAGYQPEDIDEIYLTHMHGDHVGGLVLGTERAFPNATVYAHKKEAEQWLNESRLNAAPADTKRFYQAPMAALAPYINAGKFQLFEGNSELLPGIKAYALFGHTPGHTAFFIESKGRTLVLWGDIIHVAAVQFADPSVTISFDSDKGEAAKTRQQILAEAAKNGWLVGGAHLSFPGLGSVRTGNDNGYVFLPDTGI